jgi:hypothetical protein
MIQAALLQPCQRFGALQQVLVIVVHDLTQQRLTVVVEVGQF